MPDMMLTMTLVMVVAGAGDVTVEAPPTVEPVRFHGELSFLAAGGVASVPALGAGAGLHAEAGVVLGGSHVLSARASFATVVVLFAMQFGASFAERLGDQVTLGAGLSWGALFGLGDLAGAATVQVPVRLTWCFGGVARRGLTLGAELAPGLVYAGGGYMLRPTLPGASVMAMLTVGYAVW